MQFFRTYHWPGNVRELEHLIEGAMNTIGPDTTLRISHLPPHLLLHQVRDEGAPVHVVPLDRSANQPVEKAGNPDLGVASPGAGVQDLRERRQEQEAKMIDDALRAAGGDVSAAARRLNVSRQLIHYKMRKYGLRRTAYRGSIENDPAG